MSGTVNVTMEDASGPFFAGVDVGGTNIKLGIVDNLGRCCAYQSIPTEEERGPQDAMQRSAHVISEMCAELGLAEADLAVVGLATPGTMDIVQGVLLHPHNLPHWWNFPIRSALQTAIRKTVTFANDANAAAFGEFWVGSGSDYHSIVLFTLGTGVGGGVIIGDLSLDGENSAGSEVGHAIIDYNDSARMCGCGQRGHLEAYASGKAVVLRTLERLQHTQTASTLRTRVAAVDELTPLDIADAAEAGDEVALDIILETAKFLGVGAVNAMHVIDPGAVIFGGAMNFGGESTELGQRFLNRIRAEVAARAFPVLAERTQIHFASLGGDAGFIGAAGLARASFRKSS